MTPSPPLPRRTLYALLALALASVATAQQQPGRVPCGTTAPDQSVCDRLEHPASQRAIRIPIGSECVQDARSGGYYCGYSGAACRSDLQCDFGRCSGRRGKPGICLGGLGDTCDGPDGPDDSLCAGNLGCSGHSLTGPGRAVCGGLGAECLYTGSYVPGDTPNHQACVSGYCDPTSLSCARPSKKAASARKVVQLDDSLVADGVQAPLLSPKQAQQQRQQALQEARHAPPLITAPPSLNCPLQFTACPVRKGLAQKPPAKGTAQFEFGCFDTRTSVRQCGGCAGIGTEELWPTSGQGVDCLALPGVASAACVDSQCRVFSCAQNYEFDRRTSTCTPKRYW